MLCREGLHWAVVAGEASLFHVLVQGLSALFLGSLLKSA